MSWERTRAQTDTQIDKQPHTGARIWTNECTHRLVVAPVAHRPFKGMKIDYPKRAGRTRRNACCDKPTQKRTLRSMSQSQQGSGANPISDQIPRGKLVTTSGWVGGSLGWWRCIDIQIILFRPFRTFFGLTLNNFSVVPYRPLPPTSSQALLANQDIWMGSGFENLSKTLSKSDQTKKITFDIDFRNALGRCLTPT